jgi:hypothetical protein
MTTALNEIIIRANEEISLARAKLEVEESGREVAGLQGRISGYKKLISFIAAEFHMSEGFIENTGDIATKIQDMDDTMLMILQSGITILKSSDAWAAVLNRIAENTEGIKDHLLFRAEKSRELDIGQGQYKASTFFNGLFSDVDFEHRKRKDIAEKKANEPELPFDEEDQDDTDDLMDGIEIDGPTEQDDIEHAREVAESNANTDLEDGKILQFNPPVEQPAEA